MSMSWLLSVLLLGVPFQQPGPRSLPGDLRIMAGPIAQNVTDHSATIFWLTSRDAAMSLKYWLTEKNLSQIAPLESPPATEKANQEHRALLKNLQPDQTYFFQVLNDAGEVAASGQFQTEPSEYAQLGLLRIVDGPVFEYLDSTSVEIAWTTSTQSSTVIRYGIDPNDLRKTATAPWGQETHRVQISGLKPNTQYYFVVESAQARNTGTMAKSAEGSFRTENQGEAALTDIEPRR